MPEIDEVDDKDFTMIYLTNQTVLAFDLQHKRGVKFLPKNFFSIFPDLIVVQFWNCSVINVEDHFKGLLKLKTLTLRYNKIEHIASDAFKDLVGLEELNLGDNRIQFLGKNTFATLKSLKWLYLNDNKIQILHPQTFGSLVKVELISLIQNIISAVDENAFKNSTKLKELYLTGNKLETIPKNLFKENLRLVYVFLGINNIKFIDGRMFDQLPNLKLVDLKDNFCIDQHYRQDDFDEMRRDLQENCNKTVTLRTVKTAATTTVFNNQFSAVSIKQGKLSCTFSRNWIARHND